jgi:hypothetical protein
LQQKYQTQTGVRVGVVGSSSIALLV